MSNQMKLQSDGDGFNSEQGLSRITFILIKKLTQL